MNTRNDRALVLALLWALSSVAMCGNLATDAAIGGGLGGALGGAIGAQVGGKQGAVIGAGLGAAAGASLNTQRSPEGRSPYRNDYERYSDDDDDHHGNRHRKHRDFCPPGQAKKGNC